MTDLTTSAGLADHYQAVRQRLWNGPQNPDLMKPKKVVKTRPVERWQMWPPVRLPRVKAPSFVAKKLEPEPQSEEYIRLITTADIIIAEVAKKHKLTVQMIKSHRRWKEIVEARQEVFWRLSRETTMSLPMMGRKLGGFDHTTVLHSIRRHEERRQTAAEIKWFYPGQAS